MLKKIGEKTIENTPAVVRIGDASFPSPFRGGLEYSSPARGTWNIVHTGMLVPEAHEIFVCAASCLRGVVLTAAEMNALDRFSTVEVKENNLLDGDMEELLIDGVSDVINKLEKRPPAVLVYTSCVHHFTGCDWKVMFGTLKERFPDIDIVDCYMNPTLRKSGLTPDQIMRRQLYALLKERPLRKEAVAIIGNDLPTRKNSDLYILLEKLGMKIHEITSCKTYTEYQEMAESSIYISYYPSAKAGGDTLAKRLGGKHIYLPYSWDYDEIKKNLDNLRDLCVRQFFSDRDENGAAEKNVDARIAECNEEKYWISDNQETDKDYSKYYEECIEECEASIEKAYSLIGDTPIAIDYTFCPRPTSVAKVLLEHGFNVKRIYLDSFTGEEEDDYEFLKANYPELMLYATIDIESRFMASSEKETNEKWLAIGQKAAYFLGTDHFVNIVEGGGMFGFEAITDTMELLCDAFENKKDMRSLVQIKGMGCGCCSIG